MYIIQFKDGQIKGEYNNSNFSARKVLGPFIFSTLEVALEEAGKSHYATVLKLEPVALVQTSYTKHTTIDPLL